MLFSCGIYHFRLTAKQYKSASFSISYVYIILCVFSLAVEVGNSVVVLVNVSLITSVLVNFLLLS